LAQVGFNCAKVRGSRLLLLARQKGDIAMYDALCACGATEREVSKKKKKKKKQGPNAKCACGSKKKYKKCCMNKP
jgi:hypothetical protein